jgi:hypothetical protein
MKKALLIIFAVLMTLLVAGIFIYRHTENTFQPFRDSKTDLVDSPREPKNQEVDAPAPLGEDVTLPPVSEISVGDMLSGMRVESVKIYPNEYFDGTRDFTVLFSGEAQVAGSLNGPGMGCDVGLELDTRSIETLPRFAEYQVRSLCFENSQDVINAIGTSKISAQETVTVNIENFRIVYAHKGAGPNATFVSLVR